MKQLKQLWVKCFGERLNKQEFQNVVDLLQSDCEEDFLLGRAILESRNIKLGKSRLDKIRTNIWRFTYNQYNELGRANYYNLDSRYFTITEWQPKDIWI